MPGESVPAAGVIAGIGRIEQRLDDLSRRLAAIEDLVTAGTANR